MGMEIMAAVVHGVRWQRDEVAQPGRYDVMRPGYLEARTPGFQDAVTPMLVLCAESHKGSGV
ncbi:MAG: hypothetical protein SPJ68_03615 [Arcanobacterium sp.]|nr:hypothetical protein [Arcanobacterium sp.]